MVDPSAVAALITGSKNLFDLSKAALDVAGSVKAQSKVIELQSQILSIQHSALAASETQTALLNRIKQLESEIGRLKEWDADKDKYRFEDVGAGAFVYSPKAEPTATEPNHWLCVKCFDGKQRAVLQNQGRSKSSDLSVFGCPTCKSTINVQLRRGPHNRGELMSDGTRRPS